jgi:hypothetical protein
MLTEPVPSVNWKAVVTCTLTNDNIADPDLKGGDQRQRVAGCDFTLTLTARTALMTVE